MAGPCDSCLKVGLWGLWLLVSFPSILGKPNPQERLAVDSASYPAIDTLTARSRAVVLTDRPARYAKQLASHFGHKITVEEVEGGHRLTFNRDGNFGGYGDVLVQEVDGIDRLVLLTYAATPEGRERLEGVLGRHLERFGEKDGLAVTFVAL